MTELSDAELMIRVQTDDPEAFGVLFDRYGARARHVARAIQRAPASSEDIVQDAFLGVWRSRASYQADRGSVHAWLLGIVRLRAIDAARSTVRHARRRTDDQDSADRVVDRLDVEELVGERDRATGVRAALAKLPEPQRDVIVLAYFGELSASEIAHELSLPLGTVKGRIRLGLERLRGADVREVA